MQRCVSTSEIGLTLDTTPIRRFYVYEHIRLDNSHIFYIGKGTGNRAWVIKGRNIFWDAVANFAGYRVNIFKDNLTETEAFFNRNIKDI